jgi:hypothetical protein
MLLRETEMIRPSSFRLSEQLYRIRVDAPDRWLDCRST